MLRRGRFLRSSNFSPRRVFLMNPEPLPPLRSPVPLEPTHNRSAFDCGAPALEEYLKKFALVNHQNKSARTYVTLRGETVVGYSTLAAGSVCRQETPARVAKGLSHHPVPII